MFINRRSDHYDVIFKIKTRPGSGTSLFVPQLNRFYVASQALGELEAAVLVFEPVRRSRLKDSGTMSRWSVPTGI